MKSQNAEYLECCTNAVPTFHYVREKEPEDKFLKCQIRNFQCWRTVIFLHFVLMPLLFWLVR